MKAFLLVAALLFAVLLGVAFFSLPTYSWNQKMTITVEADGAIYSGSSVVRIRWRKNDPLSSVNGPEWVTSERGEAPFVEVPGHGVLFALLNPPGNYTYASDLALKAFSDELSNGSFAERLQTLNKDTGLSTALPRELYPFFVAFDNIRDPKSIHEVDPRNLATGFGSGVRLKGVSLQITNEAVTTGQIEGVADWMTWPREKWNSLSNDGRIPMRLQLSGGNMKFVSRSLLKSGD